jgi:hypothetical protein
MGLIGGRPRIEIDGSALGWTFEIAANAGIDMRLHA